MVEITAIDKDGIREKITDLYWFEEHYVHNFDDERYTFVFDVIVDDNIITLK